MPAVPLPTQRPSGSTRGFTTVDPERQGVIVCLSDLARNPRATGAAGRTLPRDLLAAASPLARGASTVRGTPAR